MNAGLAHFVDVPEPLVFRRLAAYAGSGDNGGVVLYLGRHLNAAVEHGFLGGHHGKLREAVDHIGGLRRHEIGSFEIPDLAAVLTAQIAKFRAFDAADAATPLAK